ncbi:hypothetical protein LINGRAHAP2_LOCUS3362 [Linum grandiflorum]
MIYGRGPSSDLVEGPSKGIDRRSSIFVKERMEGGSSEQPKKKKMRVSKDDVITKLKDDGDFDNLRLKIIRKLKDNEEFRSGIISMVRQSAALNREGAANMKPRQLSDAIFDEVGNTMIAQMSDSLWGIIKSEEMRNEITETVQSVYDKMEEPEKKKEAKSCSQDVAVNRKESNIVDSQPCAVGDDPNEPPGFSMPDIHQNNGDKLEDTQPPKSSQRSVEEHSARPNRLAGVMEVHDVYTGIQPGVSADGKQNQLCDGSDDDPEVPPGFG